MVEETEFRAGFEESAAVLEIMIVDLAVGFERDAAAAEVAVERRDALPREVVSRRARGTDEQAGITGEGVGAYGVRCGDRAGGRKRGTRPGGKIVDARTGEGD